MKEKNGKSGNVENTVAIQAQEKKPKYWEFKVDLLRQ